MKYDYKFRTGEESVEIDDEWAEVLKELDHQDLSLLCVVRRVCYSIIKKQQSWDAFGR